MSVSEDQLTKKINKMKLLASKRIDQLLNVHKARPHDMKSSFFSSLYEWLKK